MRSTATFEPDVSSRLEKLMSRRRQTKKSVFNEVMRRGLDVLEQEQDAPPKPYVLVPFENSGAVLDRRSAHEILDDMDAEAFLDKHPHLKRGGDAR